MVYHQTQRYQVHQSRIGWGTRELGSVGVERERNKQEHVLVTCVNKRGMNESK
jgi:hypothetical protein